MLYWILFMAITKWECINLLKDQFVSDFSQMDNVSNLTKKARWENKSECLSFFDNSYTSIKEVLENWAKTEKEWIVDTIKNVTDKDIDGRFTAAVDSISWDRVFEDPHEILNISLLIGKWILIWFLSIILLSLFVRMLKVFLRYLYWFCNAHRIVFLKVLLPRCLYINMNIDKYHV